MKMNSISAPVVIGKKIDKYGIIAFSLLFAIYCIFVLSRTNIMRQEADGLNYLINGLSILADKTEMLPWFGVTYDSSPYLKSSGSYPNQLYSILRALLYKFTGSFALSGFILLLPVAFSGILGLYLTARIIFQEYMAIIVTILILCNVKVVSVLSDGITDAMAFSSFLLIIYLCIANHRRYVIGVIVGSLSLFRLQLLSMVLIIPFIMPVQADKRYLRKMCVVGFFSLIPLFLFNLIFKIALINAPGKAEVQSWSYYSNEIKALCRFNIYNFWLNTKVLVCEYSQLLIVFMIILCCYIYNKHKKNLVSISNENIDCIISLVAIAGILLMPIMLYSDSKIRFDVRYVVYAVPLIYLILFRMLIELNNIMIKRAVIIIVMVITLLPTIKTQPSSSNFINRFWAIDSWLNNINILTTVKDNFNSNSIIISPWNRSYLFLPSKMIVNPPTLDSFINGNHNNNIDGLFLINNHSDDIKTYYVNDTPIIIDKNGNVFARILHNAGDSFSTIIYKRVK